MSPYNDGRRIITERQSNDQTTVVSVGRRWSAACFVGGSDVPGQVFRFGRMRDLHGLQRGFVESVRAIPQMDVRPEEISPVKIRIGTFRLQITILFAHEPGQATIGIVAHIADGSREAAWTV